AGGLAVNVAFAAQQRGQRGDQAGGDREVECHREPIGERRGDQRGEEAAPGQGGGAGGGQVAKQGPEERTHRVVAEQGGDSTETGGREAIRVAAAGGIPCARSPWKRVAGSEAARPRMMRVKKIPMDKTVPEFWKVVLMPAPAPWRCGGRLFMIAARFGEANSPMPAPLSRRTRANCQ